MEQVQCNLNASSLTLTRDHDSNPLEQFNLFDLEEFHKLNLNTSNLEQFSILKSINGGGDGGDDTDESLKLTCKIENENRTESEKLKYQRKKILY